MSSPLALLADGCFLLALFIILWIQFLRFLKAAIKLFSFLELNVFPWQSQMGTSSISFKRRIKKLKSKGLGLDTLPVAAALLGH